jgi:hypothetical protein
LIGAIFLALMLFSPGNTQTGKLRYHLKNRHKRIYLSVFSIFLVFSIGSLFTAEGGLTPERGVEISFWVSLIFMGIYLQADDILITDTGVGFADLFGKVRGRFYPWDMVKSGTLSRSRVVFILDFETKDRRVQQAIKSLDEKTFKEVERAIQKSSASYTNGKR